MQLGKNKPLIEHIIGGAVLARTTEVKYFGVLFSDDYEQTVWPDSGRGQQNSGAHH